MVDRRFAEWAQHTLGGINLFAGVGTDTVIGLGNKARWRRRPPGAALVQAGEVNTSFLALVQGATRLRYHDGRPDVVAEAGETLGLRMCLYSGPAWATIRATTPVLVAEIHRLDLFHAMALSPALSTNVGRMLAGRGHHVEPRERLDTQMMKALAESVAGLGAGSGEAPLPAPVDPAVWATLLGVDKSDVERALSRLERHRIVRRSPMGVQYVDRDRLAERLR
ncbi:MAG: Crp/Fnr family transcriptional regulator [Alphaproteobacteria bacterium]